MDAALPALALGAGLISFTSPCTLPLVPGYMSFMSGVGAGRGRSLAAATLFVTGFAIVFTALGAVASGVGQTLLQNRPFLQRVAGALILVMGLTLVAGSIPRLAGRGPLALLQIEGRPLLEKVRPGPPGAFFLGVAFAAGWTPCVGPVLGSILILAGGRATLAEGAGLLFLYSLGLGLPFLAAALLLERFQGAGGWLRRHLGAVNGAGGLLLLAMGALLLAGRLDSVLAPALELYARLRWPPI